MNDMAKIEGKAGRMTAGSARAMLAETFSESFSKWVRNGSSLQWPSYLILFGKSRNFDSKNGHEPPDSDLRLQSELRVQQGLGRFDRATVSRKRQQKTSAEFALDVTGDNSAPAGVFNLTHPNQL